jgi:hypothetical protein
MLHNAGLLVGAVHTLSAPMPLLSRTCQSGTPGAAAKKGKRKRAAEDDGRDADSTASKAAAAPQLADEQLAQLLAGAMTGGQHSSLLTCCRACMRVVSRTIARTCCVSAWRSYPAATALSALCACAAHVARSLDSPQPSSSSPADTHSHDLRSAMPSPAGEPSRGHATPTAAAIQLLLEELPSPASSLQPALRLLAQLALHVVRPLEEVAASAAADQAMVGSVAGSEAAMTQHAHAVAQLSSGSGGKGSTAGSAAGVSRWKRSVGWRPCAMGNLPDAFDPNGTLPHLGDTVVVGAPHCERLQAEPIGHLVGGPTVQPTAEVLLTEQFCEVPDSPRYFDKFDVLGACGDEQKHDTAMLPRCSHAGDMQDGLGNLAGSMKLLLG